MQYVNSTTNIYHGTPKDLPGPIQLALARVAGRVGQCADIKPKARMLLSEFLRCVSYREPEGAVRVRNETLALALGISERSVIRLKKELELDGWISRHQVKSRRRGMQITDVWLTNNALQALGLNKKITTSPVDNYSKSYPQVSAMRQPKKTDALSIPQSSSKRQVDNDLLEICNTTIANDSEIEIPLSKSEMEILIKLQDQYGNELDGMDEDEHKEEETNPQVPKDLSLLANLGLKVPAIRKLMGLASNLGLRLGDIVNVAGKNISNARKTFSYVVKLINSKKDWKSLSLQLNKYIPNENSVVKELSDSNDEEKVIVNEFMQAIDGNKILSHKKKKFAWRKINDVIYQSCISDAVTGSDKLGKEWLPQPDIKGLANAWKNGNVFIVDIEVIKLWIKDKSCN